MYHLFGINQSVKNIYLLSHKFILNETPKNTVELKKYYLDFLKEHQPHQPVNYSENIIINDELIEEKLLNAYHISALNDLGQSNLIGKTISHVKKEQLQHKVKEAIELIKFKDESLYHLLHLVIHSIFFRESESSPEGFKSVGGSSSTAMGTIWISDSRDFTTEDYAELLLHELTHHLLFIFERCHAQFNYSEMVKPENFAQSAILNKKRPLDKVVHSIAVAVEIIIARKNIFKGLSVTAHPSTEILKKQVCDAISDVQNLNNINELITPWTKELLHQCLQAIGTNEKKFKEECYENTLAI